MAARLGLGWGGCEPYSPECVEGEFSEVELRRHGVLGSSLPLEQHPSNPNNPHHQRCACPFCCATIALLRRCYREPQE
jgi:hypothetical protein